MAKRPIDRAATSTPADCAQVPPLPASLADFPELLEELSGNEMYKYFKPMLNRDEVRAFVLEALNPARVPLNVEGVIAYFRRLRAYNDLHGDVQEGDFPDYLRWLFTAILGERPDRPPEVVTMDLVARAIKRMVIADATAAHEREAAPPELPLSELLPPGKVQMVLKALEAGQKVTARNVSEITGGRKLAALKVDVKRWKKQDLSAKVLKALKDIPAQ